MDLLAETWDSFEVKGAAQDASPSLILGTSSSPSMSASLSVIDPKSNLLHVGSGKTKVIIIRVKSLPSPSDSSVEQFGAAPRLLAELQQLQGGDVQ